MLLAVGCGAHTRLATRRSLVVPSRQEGRLGKEQPSTASLGIFRTRQAVRDRLPASLARKVASYPSKLSGGMRVSLGSARLLPTKHYKTWALTNYHSAVCLLQRIPVSEHRSYHFGYDFRCAPIAVTLRGDFVTTLTGGRGAPVGSTIEGLVPDGVTDILLSTASGSSQQVPIRANSYEAVASNPSAASFYVGHARYVVPIPDAPRLAVPRHANL